MKDGLHLLIYPGRLYPDHWALFIAIDAKNEVGCVLEAAGDVKDGFQFNLVENFNLLEENRTYILQHLSDLTDIKRVVEVCRETPTPGPSLRSATSTEIPIGRINQINCQDWVLDALKALETEGLVAAGTVDSVKK